MEGSTNSTGWVAWSFVCVLLEKISVGLPVFVLFFSLPVVILVEMIGVNEKCPIFLLFTLYNISDHSTRNWIDGMLIIISTQGLYHFCSRHDMGVSSIQCNVKHEYIMATGRWVFVLAISLSHMNSLSDGICLGNTDHSFNICNILAVKKDWSLALTCKICLMSLCFFDQLRSNLRWSGKRHLLKKFSNITHRYLSQDWLSYW